MKKWYQGNKALIVSVMVLSLTACGGNKAVKKPIEEKPPIEASDVKKKPGGYYKDDGPSDEVPENLDGIPDAVPQFEEYSTRANQPYVALEKRYTPMTAYEAYKVQGMASWYGKRYHGGKTSTGEIYDMYGMTAAHKTLPIPSYARVTNADNGKSIVVRINDRGPFINGRIIDLSYAAAHKLGMIEAGQTQVEVEAIDTRPEALQQGAAVVEADTVNEAIIPKDPVPEVEVTEPVQIPTVDNQPSKAEGFYVQVGAFQSELNSQKLIDKLAGFDATEPAKVFQALSGGIYRVKMGPYPTRAAADQAAETIKQQYNIKGIVQHHD